MARSAIPVEGKRNRERFRVKPGMTVKYMLICLPSKGTNLLACSKLIGKLKRIYRCNDANVSCLHSNKVLVIDKIAVLPGQLL